MVKLFQHTRTKDGKLVLPIAISGDYAYCIVRGRTESIPLKSFTKPREEDIMQVLTPHIKSIETAKEEIIENEEPIEYIANDVMITPNVFYNDEEHYV